METVWMCPLCESDPTHHHYFERVIGKKWEGEYRYEPVFFAICDNCGLVFQWQRMNEQETYQFYTAQYRATVQGGFDGVTERVLTEQQKRVDFLLPEIDLEPKAVLDIGASTGLLLKALREKYDCTVMGIEPGEKFRMHAKSRYEIKMLSDLDIAHKEYHNAFDLITCIHTLEHFVDPRRILIRLHDYITEDGHLLIEVPHLFNENTLSLNHPISFTPDTLTEMLSRTGWEIVWLKEYHGFKEPYPNPPNILVLAKPGAVVENVMYVDIEDIERNYREGQQTLKDHTWTPPQNVGQVYKGKGTAGGKN